MGNCMAVGKNWHNCWHAIRVSFARGAGMAFHCGGGGGGHDLRRDDRSPTFLALIAPVGSLDNLDCRFFARTSHIRIDQRNPAFDYSRHD